MSKVYLDTETCGLHSQIVLLQYAEEDGPIVLHEVWRRPIHETLTLIEWLCEHTIVGFNLAFDWFHIVKCYTTFRLADPNWIPCEHIEEIALLEPKGQDGPCVKPVSALDLLLHSRKGPYQSLMAWRMPWRRNSKIGSNSMTSTSPRAPTRMLLGGRCSIDAIVTAP